MAAELPPHYKFDPDDDELVAHYLLPRLRGHRLPLDGVFVEDDPLSAPPWALLRKHGRGKDAFFFAAGQATSGKGSRRKRDCAGAGSWVARKKLVAVDGAGVEGTITWRKRVLDFHGHGETGREGWVMDEFAVTAPTKLASSSLMAYHIRRSGRAKKRHDSVVDADAGAHAMVDVMN